MKDKCLLVLRFIKSLICQFLWEGSFILFSAIGIIISGLWIYGPSIFRKIAVWYTVAPQYDSFYTYYYTEISPIIDGMESVLLFAVAELIAASIYIVLFLISQMRKKEAPMWKTNKLTWKRSFHIIYIGIILNAVITLLVNLIPRTILEKTGYIEATTFDSTNFLVVIGIGIGAPILEELLYRYFMYNSMEKLNWKLSLVITSIFFGVSHGNIVQGTYAFLLSIMFILMDRKYQSILPSLIIHIAVNFPSMTAVWLSNVLPSGLAGLIALIGMLFLIMSSFIADVIINIKQIKEEKVSYFLRW